MSDDYATFREPQELHDALLQFSSLASSNRPDRIRVVLLSSLKHESLMETELNGGVDGPN